MLPVPSFSLTTVYLIECVTPQHLISSPVDGVQYTVKIYLYFIYLILNFQMYTVINLKKGRILNNRQKSWGGGVKFRNSSYSARG